MIALTNEVRTSIVVWMQLEDEELGFLCRMHSLHELNFYETHTMLIYPHISTNRFRLKVAIIVIHT